MSVPATSPSAASAPSTHRRPPLSVVAVPPRSRRAPFALLVLSLLAVGLLGLLLLNTLAAEDAFRLHTLQQRGADLDRREQELATQLHRLESPDELAARARQLGMVPGGEPAYLRLPDGAVIGADPAAPTGPRVQPPPASPSPASAAPAAQPSPAPSAGGGR